MSDKARYSQTHAVLVLDTKQRTDGSEVAILKSDDRVTAYLTKDGKLWEANSCLVDDPDTAFSPVVSFPDLAVCRFFLSSGYRELPVLDPELAEDFMTIAKRKAALGYVWNDDVFDFEPVRCL